MPLPLAVVPPDADQRGVTDALRVPDTQEVAVLDDDAQTDASALQDAHPEELGEAVVERDAEAHVVAVPQAVESGVAAALAVPVLLVVGTVDGDAHEDGEMLVDAQKEALSDAELEREDAGLPLSSVVGD